MDNETSNLDKPLADTIDQSGGAASYIDCIQSSIWWKNAGVMSFVYARQCVVPAALWLTSLSFFVFPCVFIIKTLNSGSIDISQLLFVGVVYMAAVFIALPTMFWSFGSWLMCLTAFCQAFCSFSAHEMIDSTLEKRRIIAAQKEALAKTRLKKVFLAKFWSSLTVFLAVPCIVLFVAMMVLTAASSSVLGSSAIRLPVWALAVTYICLFGSFALTTEVSLVALCVSANSNSNPLLQAKRSVSISFKRFVPLMLITGFSALVIVLVTSPYELLQSAHAQEPFAINISWWSVVEELWRTISSLVMWTFTLAPMCEYLRETENAG